MNRTDRLYAIVEELRARAPGHVTAPTLARRFEVSVRTIERDLSALQQSGVPIYATPGRRGGYAIDTAMTLPPVNFTAAEAAAIATALTKEASTPFGAAARTALHKVVAAMTATDAEAARHLARRVRVFARNDDGDMRAPAVVEDAIVRRVVVAIDYADKHGAVTSRDVEPVGVVGVHPNWYLWGWCRLRNEVRAFRLDRIRGARLTDDAVPDRGLDPGTITIPDLVGRPGLLE